MTERTARDGTGGQAGGTDRDVVTLSLCGDVMLGRGVDQILPHPGDPTLREALVKDARRYVELAEERNGPIPRPVGFSWPWGTALQTLDEAAPDARVVTLETSITRSDRFAADKAVNYRMHPDNVPCLAAARPDVCALANNHVLDFGHSGLEETLDALAGAGLQTAGAGHEADEARRPAVVPLGGGGRVLVFSLGTASSGIPAAWQAGAGQAGVAWLRAPSDEAAVDVVSRIRQRKQPGDLVVVSIHWGSNWGYQVPQQQVRFAHALIEGGVDLVHGHSSHHPRPLEVYRGRLILYGCGDFIDDYEGITGHEEYRDDLRVLYLAAMERASGVLSGLRMIPFQARRMRLEDASCTDVDWLRGVLTRISDPFGVAIDRGPDRALTLQWE